MSPPAVFCIHITIEVNAWWGRGGLRRSAIVLAYLLVTAFDVFMHGVEPPAGGDDEGS